MIFKEILNEATCLKNFRHFHLSDLMFNEPCPSKRKKSAKTIKRYNYKNK